MKVLILVDCQKDFMDKDGALYVPGAENIKEDIVEISRGLYDKVVVTYDTHTVESYEETIESEMFPIHCVKGTDGHKLFKELKNSLKYKKYAFHFEKNKFDIWTSCPEYLEWVKDNLNTDDEFTIVGVATNYCVYDHIKGLLKRGFKNITLASNGTKAIDDQTIVKRMEWMVDQGVKVCEVL